MTVTSPAEFFKTLYQNCERGKIEFRFLPSKRQNFVSLDELDKKLPAFPQNQNCYFGVATRDGKGGGKENIIEIPALWVDIDFKHVLQQKADKKLSEFPLRPSIVVNSGGGYHVYFLLKEAFEKSDIALAESYLKRLATYLNADMAATDASRILRVPGSLNVKYTPAALVEIVKLDASIQYNSDDFDFLPELEEATNVIQNNTTSDVDDKFKFLLARCDFLEHCDEDRATLSEPHWLAMISNLCREPGGNDLIHALSKDYPGYSRKETDQKILHVINGSGPTTCEHIKTLYNCCRTCNVTSPINLLMNRKKESAANTKKAEKTIAVDPILVKLADVEAEEVSWLWNPFIPLGKLTLLEGDPGIGKTWLALQLAANVSTGGPFPGSDGALGARREPGSVLYLTAEDGLGDTLRPRLDKAEADVSRIFVLTGFTGTDENGKEKIYAVTLEAIAVIEKAIQKTMPALMVVDPLQAYLGAHVDMHRANEVRPILARLSELAEKYSVAILCIRHLSKSAQDRAIYRGLGSIDFSAAARSVLLVGEDTQDKEKKILTHCKSSLAPKGISQVFELREGQFLWAGTSELTSESLFMPSASDDEKTAIEEAEEFLKEELANGTKEATEIFKEAKKQGHSEKTIKRAKKKLNVQAIRKGEAGKKGGGIWLWFFPDQEGQDEDLKKNVIAPFLGPLDPLNKSLEPQGLAGNHLEGHMTPLINLNKPASLLASDYGGQGGQENALREKNQNDQDDPLKNDQVIELSSFEFKERV